MKKYIQLFVVLISTIAVTSCGSNELEVSVNTVPSIQVKTKKAERNSEQPTLSISGTVKAAKEASISTRMMGQVDQVLVEVGERVQKGQLLVLLKMDDLQAQMAQVEVSIKEAELVLKNAERDHTRFKNLFDKKSVSVKELEDKSLRLELAMASVEATNQKRNEVLAQFHYTELRAPFSGSISDKFIEAGAMAYPGVPLVSIESQGTFEIESQVPEMEISKIHSGMEVNVMLKSLDITVPAIVDRISSSARNNGGQYKMTVVLTEQPSDLRAGMYVAVHIPTEIKMADSDQVLIYKSAVVRRGQLTGIFTLSQSHTALLRWLRLGKEYGDKVAVLSGLSIGETYIMDADGKLSNGTSISIK